MKINKKTKQAPIEKSMDRVEDFITPTEAANLKGITRAAIYTAIAEGRLPHTKVLGRIALRRVDVQTWQPVRYAGRPGRKGGRPPGSPTSPETRTRLSQAIKASWDRRKQMRQESSDPESAD